MRELQGRWSWAPLGWGRSADVQSCRTGSLWPSAGVALRGMAREYAAGNSRRPGWREFAGTLGQLQACLQAGSGMARSRAKALLNWVSQCQRRGRCKVRRRAERVIRRLSVWCSRSVRPDQSTSASGPGFARSPRPPARCRWRRNARWHVVQPVPLLEVSNGILNLDEVAVVGLQFEYLPVPVGDEAVIAIFGEEG